MYWFIVLHALMKLNISSEHDLFTIHEHDSSITTSRYKKKFEKFWSIYFTISGEFEETFSCMSVVYLQLHCIVHGRSGSRYTLVMWYYMVTYYKCAYYNVIRLIMVSRNLNKRKIILLGFSWTIESFVFLENHWCVTVTNCLFSNSLAKSVGFENKLIIHWIVIRIILLQVVVSDYSNIHSKMWIHM